MAALPQPTYSHGSAAARAEPRGDEKERERGRKKPAKKIFIGQPSGARARRLDGLARALTVSAALLCAFWASSMGRGVLHLVGGRKSQRCCQRRPAAGEHQSSRISRLHQTDPSGRRSLSTSSDGSITLPWLGEGWRECRRG